MSEGIEEYNPQLDFSPNARDHFAMMEHTQPHFNTEQELADFLGVPVVMVEKRGMRTFMPQAFARWRYMCADAMIQARRK